MRLPSSIERLDIDLLPADHRLVRSRRKTLAIHVSHDQIEIRAPLFVGQREIVRFVEKNRDWVIRTHEEKTRRHGERLVLEDGAIIFYKARPRRLVLVDADQPMVTVDEHVMRICGPAATSGRAGAILQRWLMDQARAWLPPRTRALADYLGVAQRLHDVVLRKTRSKWGHCTAQGRIQYNWLIMLAPDAVIDYMISHEVCHLIHMNHSPAYWKVVASVCPDYRQYEGWLRRHEHRLWF